MHYVTLETVHNVRFFSSSALKRYCKTPAGGSRSPLVFLAGRRDKFTLFNLVGIHCLVHTFTFYFICHHTNL